MTSFSLPSEGGRGEGGDRGRGNHLCQRYSNVVAVTSSLEDISTRFQHDRNVRALRRVFGIFSEITLNRKRNNRLFFPQD